MFISRKMMFQCFVFYLFAFSTTTKQNRIAKMYFRENHRRHNICFEKKKPAATKYISQQKIGMKTHAST